MHLTIERRAVARTNGDVDEYITLVLDNRGPYTQQLKGTWISVSVTDADGVARYVSDGLEGNPETKSGKLHGRFVVALRARGAVPPLGKRFIGVHITCRERCSVEEDRLTFRDPFILDDMNAFDPVDVHAVVSIIFPGEDLKREIRASGSAHRTSRTATWEYSPSRDHQQQLHATLELSSLPPAACLLDDGIAELHELIGQDAAGEPIDLRRAERSLAQAFDTWAIGAPASLGTMATIASLSAPERQLHLRELLRDLEEIRPAFRDALPVLKHWNEPLTVGQRVLQEVLNLVEKAAIAVPPPDGFVDALMALICYAEMRRLTSSNSLTRESTEKDFQSALHEYLLTTHQKVEREVPTGSGRIDFLLGKTPVELKVRDLGTRPEARVLKHTQQVADYAANRGSAVGVLVVLNTADFSKEREHQAHLLEDVRIDLVTARPSARQSTGTVVVSIVVTAIPPRPSHLR